MNSHEQDQEQSIDLPNVTNTDRAKLLPVEGEGNSLVSEKQATINTEQSNGPSIASTSQSQLTQQQYGLTQQSSAATDNTDNPKIADDNDLIEKEWIIKAKEIVARTANDPYLQSKAMNEFKADYLKKRSNKELKISDDK